jgi:hypothetical protein
MDRRGLLAAIAGAAAGGAGCLGGARTGAKRSRESTDRRSDVPLSEYPCPPYAADGEAVCSHTVDTDEAEVYLLPSERTTAEPREELRFTLYNRSSRSLVFNPYQWTISERSSDGWEAIERTVAGDGKLTLAPDDRHSWSAREIVEYVRPTFRFSPDDYAVEIGVPSPGGDDWLACVSVFRVVAEE